MSNDYVAKCLTEHTRSICTVFNALVKQTAMNKILFLCGGLLALKMFSMNSESKKQREKIDYLYRELHELKHKKESNECNA